MIPAPVLTCVACEKKIPKKVGHNLTDDRRVVCSRCIFDRAHHATLWPSCPEPGHDVFDHLLHVSSTRAGIAAVLGLWSWGDAEVAPVEMDAR